MIIERVGGLSTRDFIEHFVAPRRPVVLTDAIHDWPALGRWTPAWFRETARAPRRCPTSPPT